MQALKTAFALKRNYNFSLADFADSADNDVELNLQNLLNLREIIS